MLKSKVRKMLGVFGLVSVLTAGGLVVSDASVVHAAAPSEKGVPVTYDNRTVLPDGNGQYGMIIPTSISFTDTNKTANADVEITGVGGYNLDVDWTTLDVLVKVKSDNSYKLTGTGPNIDYQLKMTNNANEFEANDTAQEITKHFGVGGNAVKKETGEAKLTGKATVKGQYSDRLTYSFEEITNERN